MITARLFLSLINENDTSFIIDLLNSEGWLKYIGDRNIHTTEDAKTYIERIQKNPDIFYWVVKLKESQIPVGIISFLKRSYLEFFDIGFAFLPAYKGYGFALEASQKVLSSIAQLKSHKFILAVTSPENKSSAKLLSALGFNFNNEITEQGKNLHVYSISMM